MLTVMSEKDRATELPVDEGFEGSNAMGSLLSLPTLNSDSRSYLPLEQGHLHHPHSRHGVGTPPPQHFHDGGDIGDPPSPTLPSHYHHHQDQLPMIVVRDRVGHKLDTDTSYQRTINEARWRIAHGETALEPEEWRLPRAPLPARPDYSRNAPPLATLKPPMRQMQTSLKKFGSMPDLLVSGTSFSPLFNSNNFSK